MSTRKAVTILAAVALAACGESATKIATGSVSGRALYQGRTDHSGISVTVAGFSTTTNATGNYSFSDIPTGTQVVIAVAPDSVERTLTTTVNVGGTAADLTFTPAQALAGIAAAVGGSSQGITVTLDGTRTTTTAADGSYSFSNVAAGSHSLGFASTGYADSISNVLYSPDLGALVADPSRNNALYRMGVFEMQSGQRLVSGSTIDNYAKVTPDGLVYGYVTVVPGTSVGTLTIAPVAGGAGVVVATNVFTGSWKFGPDSASVAWIADDNSLNSAGFTTAPLALGQLNRLGDSVNSSQYDFSPELTPGTPPAGGKATVYFVADNVQGTTNTRSLFEKVAANGSQLRVYNTVPAPVVEFRLYKKSKRILFIVGTGPYTFLSAPCTATNAASLNTVDSAVPGWTWMDTSADETKIAYFVYTGASPGLRVQALSANTSPAPVFEAGTSFGPTRFTPNGARVVWVNGSTGAIVSRLTDGTGNAPITTTSTPGYATPSFSSDSTKMVMVVSGGAPGPYQVVVANTDGTGSPVVSSVDSGNLNPTYLGQCPWYCEYSGATINPTASHVAFRKDGNLYQSPLGAFAVTLLHSTAGNPFYSADGQWLLYEAYPNYTDLYIRGIAAGSSTLVGPRYSRASNLVPGRLNADATRMAVLTNQDPLTGGYDLKYVNLTTGAVTPIVRQLNFYEWLRTGTTDRVVSVRRNSPAPFGFQDGVYLTTVP